jgi:hypothetical protein
MSDVSSPIDDLINKLKLFLQNASWETVDDCNAFEEGNLRVDINEYTMEDDEGNWGLKHYSAKVTDVATNKTLFYEYFGDALNDDLGDAVVATINYLEGIKG